MTDTTYKCCKHLSTAIIQSKVDDWDAAVNILYYYQREIRRCKRQRNKYEIDENMRKMRNHLLHLDYLSGFFLGPQMVLFSEACGFPDGSVILTEREKKHKEILKWAVTEVKKYFGYIYSEKELK